MVSTGLDKRHGNTDDPLFRQYWEHASALRNWFVVYGLGGIALCLTEAEAVAGVSPLRKSTVTGGFMLTVIAQVLLAFVNKWTHWSAHWGAKSKEYKETHRYKFAMELSNRIWIDFTLDLISLLSALIAIATLVATLATVPQNLIEPHLVGQ